MRGIVINAGRTEATRQVAESIYDGLLLDKELCSLEEVDGDLRSYDVVFVGFDMADDRISEDVQRFLGQLDDVQVALFATADDPCLSDATRAALRRNRAYLGHSARFMGGFICSGYTDTAETAHPSSGDLAGARQFAQDMYYSLRS